MARSPGVYTQIIDLSMYVESVPSTIGFICLFSEKGEDNKFNFVGSHEQLINECGKPNVVKFGKTYGQGMYVAENFVKASPSLYYIRCLPENATYANVAFVLRETFSGTNLVSSEYTLGSIPNIGDPKNFGIPIGKTSGDLVIKETVIFAIYGIGRGEYYNRFLVNFRKSVNAENEYVLYLYTTDSDDRLVSVDNYNVSFDELSLDDSGESNYIVDKIAFYQPDIRVYVNEDPSLSAHIDKIISGKFLDYYNEDPTTIVVRTEQYDGVNTEYATEIRGLFTDYNKYMFDEDRSIEDGDRVLVLYGAEGPFLGKDNMIAVWSSVAGWIFEEPQDGEAFKLETTAGDVYIKYVNLNDVALSDNPSKFFVVDGIPDEAAVDFNVLSRYINGDGTISYQKSLLVITAEEDEYGFNYTVGGFSAGSLLSLWESGETYTFIVGDYGELEPADPTTKIGAISNTLMFDNLLNDPDNNDCFFSNGTEGKNADNSAFDYKSRASMNTCKQLLVNAYLGKIDAEVTDLDLTYFNLVFDGGYEDPAIKNAIVSLCKDIREDCIAILDNGDNPSADMALTRRRNTYTFNTYYAAIYEPYSQIYDENTGRAIWITPVFHMAKYIAQTRLRDGLSKSPAGYNSASVSEIQRLRYNTRRGHRDIFYQNQLNPIVKFETNVVWGDLTSQRRASNMQLLPVVTVVLYIKRAVEQFAKYFIFDRNDAFTWSLIESGVNDLLNDLKSTRDLIDGECRVYATDYDIKRRRCTIDIRIRPMGSIHEIHQRIYVL